MTPPRAAFKLLRRGVCTISPYRIRIAGAALLVCMAAAAASPQQLTPAQRQQAQHEAAAAQQAMAQRNFNAAAQHYQALVKLAPAVAESHANLGAALYSAHRTTAAAAEFRKALAIKPSLFFARAFLDASLAESGQCALALPLLKQDLPQASDPHLRRLMANDGVDCAMAGGQLENALPFVQAMLRDAPDDPAALYTASHVYSALATQASQRLLAVAPGSLQSHQFNAEVLEMQGKISDAMDEYRKVLAMDPRLAGIHYALGRLWLQQTAPGATAKARQEFEAELKIDPTNAGAEFQLGEMARQARQWSDAIAHFRRAVQINPNYVDAQIGLGRTLISAGDPPQAVPPLQTAVRLDPSNSAAHYQLAFAYRRLGRQQEAERELAAYRATHAAELQKMSKIRTGMAGSDPEAAGH